MVSNINVEVDINNDGDTIDQNQEVILTEAEFDSLPPKEKPQAPTAPTPPEQPSAPSGPPQEPSQPSGTGEVQGQNFKETPIYFQEPTPPQQPPQPSEPSAPTQPEQPASGEKPTPPRFPPGVTLENGWVHMGQFLDEMHSVNFDDYLTPIWVTDFVYDGGNEKIIYDFSLHPTLPKEQQVSIEISTEKNL